VLLNRFERRLLTGRPRNLMQLGWDAPCLRRLGGRVDGGTVLEVGCGKGVGLRAALEIFGAATVDAFDADPRMVGLARQEATRRGYFAPAAEASSRAARVRLWQGFAGEIPSPSDHYDAVFVYQVLHHVEDWREALHEIVRVLKPGGRLFLVESLRAFLEHPLWGRWMEHPREDRFDRAQLLEALQAQGFQILGKRGLGRSFLWLAATWQPPSTE